MSLIVIGITIDRTADLSPGYAYKLCSYHTVGVMLLTDGFKKNKNVNVTQLTTLVI